MKLLGTLEIDFNFSFICTSHNVCQILTLRDHCKALSGKYLQIRGRPRKWDSTQHNEAPVAEQKHTNASASGNGKRKPDRIDNDIEPGIANVCKLKMAIKELTVIEWPCVVAGLGHQTMHIKIQNTRMMQTKELFVSQFFNDL